MARYRTGDHAELRTAADGTQRMTTLLAREPESVSLGGLHLAPGELTERLGAVPGLGDFQVVVGGDRRPTLRWAPDVLCPEPSDALVGDLRAAFRDLAPGEDVVLRRYDRITPPGGKKRRFLWDDTVPGEDGRAVATHR